MPYIPKQYDSAKAFLGGYTTMGNIVDPMDAMRVCAYNLYDDFYHNRPDTFKVTKKGASDIEIYLPSVKKMVDATARYLAVDFSTTLTGGDVETVQKTVDALWEREELNRKFVQAKKSGLYRGDTVWHITADGGKPRGSRISIHTIHPSCYFPIEDPTNSARIIGCHLVDIVPDPRETGRYRDLTKKVARRQTYRKEADGRISSEYRTFELGQWDDRFLPSDELKPVTIIMPKKLLPPGIRTIPVYLEPNNMPDGSSWGLSQVAGVEYLVNALNQSITYEDLSLVLQGLGVYVTTAQPPDGPNGQPGQYKLHPGNVVEIGADDTFQRVSGVTSVAPFQEHINFMDQYASKGLGIPDMASGRVDVSIAQSGIALALEMGPILSENEDKQLVKQGKWNQIGYDLIQDWFPTFEGVNSPDTKWNTTFGDPMPIDRTAKVEELVQLKTANLLLIEEAREEMVKLGYKNPSGITEDLIQEAKDLATAAAGDLFGGETGTVPGTDPNAF